ncbi:hypothetical protein [Prevotella multiformis]|uniref:Uncharacterized protein n=1 Tax=Prevotella multiformis DSM 16608 TaxID=888743 RepID=F0F8S8_9BACT|nr:hypothetical protein [Prevotella multiformis]EGC19455.1 hypothetical protein HMPREF9141_1995 [Prevotella multiformis DSM 16608]
MPIGSPAPGVAVMDDLDNIPPARDRNRFGNGPCRPLPAITVRRGCGPDGRPDRMRPGPARISRREVLDARLPDCPLYNKVENTEKKAVPVGGSGWIKAERQ